MKLRLLIALLLGTALVATGCESWNSNSNSGGGGGGNGGGGGGTTAAAAPKTLDQQRAEVDTMAGNALNRLYALQPGSRQVIEGAAGYAVFTNFGLQIVFVGGGAGEGVAVNNRNMARTYMKMGQLQAGIGWSLSKFQLVWVFQTEDALNDFVAKGFTVGAQASANAEVEHQGVRIEGAVPVAQGIWLYQMTSTGLALDLTVQASKYFKDDKLN